MKNTDKKYQAPLERMDRQNSRADDMSELSNNLVKKEGSNEV